MTTPTTFTCFNSLPKELRLIVWEYYFQSPRMLVIHPAPESLGRSPPREVLLFNCTVLDAGTNRVVPGGPPPSFLANREAHSVAASLHLLSPQGNRNRSDDPNNDTTTDNNNALDGTRPYNGVTNDGNSFRHHDRLEQHTTLAHRILQAQAQATQPPSVSHLQSKNLAYDLVKPYVEQRPLGDGETLSEGQIEAISNIPHFGAWRAGAGCRPVHVDWAEDLLYLSVPNAEQAFWSLRYATGWRDHVRRLAVLVPESFFEDGSRRPIPFGPAQFIREVLERMAALDELFIVLVPLPGGAVVKAGAEDGGKPGGGGDDGAAAAGQKKKKQQQQQEDKEAKQRAGMKRNAFGFVSYVDYLKKVKVANNHMGYARAALSFQQALPHIPRPIRFHKVVDVDRVSSGYGEYRRCQR
ncbi:Uu.00g069340.m01.CDS01 [Anthostomella pinea]|uniref:Uu.00g069340.m01.CDS01 n=1 Tax=Anthostomella pinea TaxID=933095 RepID=A0AAI8VVA5_9PEZI|nr:Uu.00g069340.m01.CDS01 [Anthostomella pinea]